MAGPSVAARGQRSAAASSSSIAPSSKRMSGLATSAQPCVRRRRARRWRRRRSRRCRRCAAAGRRRCAAATRSGTPSVGAVVGEHDVERPDRRPAQAGDELDQRLARRVRHDRRPAALRSLPRRRGVGDEVGPGAGPPVEPRGPGHGRPPRAPPAGPGSASRARRSAAIDSSSVRGVGHGVPADLRDGEQLRRSAPGRRRPSPRAPAARTPRRGSGRPRARPRPGSRRAVSSGRYPGRCRRCGRGHRARRPRSTSVVPAAAAGEDEVGCVRRACSTPGSGPAGSCAARASRGTPGTGPRSRGGRARRPAPRPTARGTAPGRRRGGRRRPGAGSAPAIRTSSSRVAADGVDAAPGPRAGRSASRCGRSAA